MRNTRSIRRNESRYELEAVSGFGNADGRTLGFVEQTPSRKAWRAYRWDGISKGRLVGEYPTRADATSALLWSVAP